MGPAPIRFWGDQLPPNADAIVKEKWAQVRASRPEFARNGKRPVVNFLALSGGDGAFGAGVLGGWTASGKRPEFDLVTGVSTGALTAPFAFLGPKYDEALKQVFTQSTTKDFAIAQPIRGLLGGDSLASNAPLAKVVAFYVNDAFLQEVADEHRKGRRLLIARPISTPSGRSSGTWDRSPTPWLLIRLDTARPAIDRVFAGRHPGNEIEFRPLA